MAYKATTFQIKFPIDCCRYAFRYARLGTSRLQQAGIRESLVIDDHLGAPSELLARLAHFACTAVADGLVTTEGNGMDPSPLRYESIRHTFILAHYVTPLKWGWVHSITLDPDLPIANGDFAV